MNILNIRYADELRRRSQGLPEAAASKNTQRIQKRSLSHLLNLPNELLYTIIGHLGLPWRISLALTCKFLMALAFPEHVLPRLDYAMRKELLSALQKDVTKSYLCPCCYKLQRLDLELNWRGQDHKWTCNLMNGYMPNSIWQNCHLDIKKHIVFPDDYYRFMKHGNIYFMDAHLVLDRHCYGPLHGISIRHLERCVSFETELELHRCLHTTLQSEESHKRALRLAEVAEEPVFNWIPKEQPRRQEVWRFSLRYSPKIIDNKLYMARLFTIVGPLVHWTYLARLMNSIKPRICNHMSCIILMYPVTPMYAWTIPCGHPGDFHLEFFPEKMERYWKACGFNLRQGSCLLCNTDYDVSLKPNFTNREWNFSFRAYHCLGTCQTPVDPLWNYFANTGGERTPFLRYYYLSRDDGRPFRLDGNELIFGHPTMNGEIRSKWQEYSTESERSLYDRPGR